MLLHLVKEWTGLSHNIMGNSAVSRGVPAETSMNDRTWSANSSSRSRLVTEPAVAPSTTGWDAAPSRMSMRPLSSPTGRAPDRQNFTPLYWAGLCDAVNTAPGALRWPDAK